MMAIFCVHRFFLVLCEMLGCLAIFVTATVTTVFAYSDVKWLSLIGNLLGNLSGNFI